MNGTLQRIWWLNTKTDSISTKTTSRGPRMTVTDEEPINSKQCRFPYHLKGCRLWHPIFGYMSIHLDLCWQLAPAYRFDESLGRWTCLFVKIECLCVGNSCSELVPARIPGGWNLMLIHSSVENFSHRERCQSGLKSVFFLNLCQQEDIVESWCR